MLDFAAMIFKDTAATVFSPPGRSPKDAPVFAGVCRSCLIFCLELRRFCKFRQTSLLEGQPRSAGSEKAIIVIFASSQTRFRMQGPDLAEANCVVVRILTVL